MLFFLQFSADSHHIIPQQEHHCDIVACCLDNYVRCQAQGVPVTMGKKADFDATGDFDIIHAIRKIHSKLPKQWMRHRNTHTVTLAVHKLRPVNNVVITFTYPRMVPCCVDRVPSIKCVKLQRKCPLIILYYAIQMTEYSIWCVICSADSNRHQKIIA